MLDNWLNMKNFVGNLNNTEAKILVRRPMPQKN